MRKKWTPAEVEELRSLYQKMTRAELAERFGTTPGAISQKAGDFGIKRKHHPSTRLLTEQEKLWLRINFPHMSNEICAMHLGVSLRTLVRKARELKLVKTPQFMKECQAHTSKKAVESHTKNGTWPAKGWYSPNLQKGVVYQFKKGENGKIRKLKNEENDERRD